MPLPYDPADPLMDPPRGCVNRLMWQLARRLHADHQPGSDSYCLICRPHQFYPCPPARLAIDGMAYACGLPTGASGWADFRRRRHRQNGQW